MAMIVVQFVWAVVMTCWLYVLHAKVEIWEIGEII